MLETESGNDVKSLYESSIKNNSVLLRSPCEYNDPFDGIFYADSKEKHNALLREYLIQEQAKIGRILLINTPEQKQKQAELTVKDDNIDYSEKIKQISKEIFEK